MAKETRSFEKLKDLQHRMQQLLLFEKDIKEQFVHSSGPGGQNVNKVATCVVLKHIPTGVQVKCQLERTQSANRLLARYLLVEKLEQRKQDFERQKIKKIEKERRRNRKLSKKAKEKMLEKKRYVAKKKEMRRKMRLIDLDRF